MFRCLFTAVLAGLLISSASGQADDLKLEAVKDFKIFYRQNKEVSQRVEAIMTLKGNECLPAATELFGLLRDKTEQIRVAAMQVISTYSKVETFQSWIDALPDTRDDTQVALVIEVLGKAGIQQCLPALAEIGASKKGLKDGG